MNDTLTQNQDHARFPTKERDAWERLRATAEERNRWRCLVGEDRPIDLETRGSTRLWAWLLLTAIGSWLGFLLWWLR